MHDNEIATAYRESRDPELLGILYKRYMLLVYGVCLKYLKNREDSRDAVIRIFEILSADIPRFEIINFKAWLYKVSRNHCLMELRKAGKEKKLLLHEDSIPDLMENDGHLHPLDDPGNGGIIEKLPECMEKLDGKQRECIELFYYRDKCYREIARELKTEENKVKSYIQNGKRNLKICLEKKGILKNA